VGNAARGLVLIRIRWRSVDMASKINAKKKVKKPAKNHPVNDTLARPLPHRRHLEVSNPAKTKEITSHHSPKRLGEGQPPPDLARGNKRSTTQEVGSKLTPLDQLRGNKKHPNSRGARGKSPPGGGGVRPPPPGENHAHRGGALE
jgi:hypothetical protein